MVSSLATYDIEAVAQLMRNADDDIASDFQRLSGKPKDEILTMMDEETWLSDTEAREFGFEASGGAQLNNELEVDATGKPTNESLMAFLNSPLTDQGV